MAVKSIDQQINISTNKLAVKTANQQINRSTNKFNDLDPVLNTPVRLAVVSILLKVKQADFGTLMEATETTQGNMSHQLKRLSSEGYITVEKTYKGNYPLTVCRITPKGRKAFESYVESIKKYLHL